MKNYQLQILPTTLLEEYLRLVPDQLQEKFEALEDAEISTDTFSFYTSVSSVFSSKIEGEEIELDSYVKHKNLASNFYLIIQRRQITYIMPTLLPKLIHYTKSI